MNIWVWNWYSDSSELTRTEKNCDSDVNEIWLWLLDKITGVEHLLI